MIYLPDETLEVNALIEAWLLKRPIESQESLKRFINEYFLRSLSWIKDNIQFVVDTTQHGNIMNGLSHLSNFSNKRALLYGLIRGLGANMKSSDRTLFAATLLTWANENIPDSKRPLDFFVNNDMKFEQYCLTVPEPFTIAEMDDIDSFPIIETVDMKRSIDAVNPWIESGSSFIVVGPEGCGKSTLLRHCFSKRKSTTVATIYCNAQTKTKHILQKLFQTCINSTSISGRVLRPKDADKLILYLKDINLPKPDKV